MKDVRGFTLIEIMVTIGIFTILISMGLFLSMDVWRGSSIQNEQDIVIALLYKARSQSLANINESAHGFHIDEANKTYYVFEGNTFDFDNKESWQDFPMSASVEFEGEHEIVFSAREAQLTDEASFTMTGQGKSREFCINIEGGIKWNNENCNE